MIVTVYMAGIFDKRESVFLLPRTGHPIRRSLDLKPKLERKASGMGETEARTKDANLNGLIKRGNGVFFLPLLFCAYPTLTGKRNYGMRKGGDSFVLNGFNFTVG